MIAPRIVAESRLRVARLYVGTEAGFTIPIRTMSK